MFDSVPTRQDPCMEPGVLLVEDDPDLREVVIEILSLEGFESAIAVDGQEALEYLQAGYRPRLILLDLMLPRMDGEQVGRAIERDPKLRSIPVVVFSARRDVAEVARRLAVPYLQKPFEVSNLVAAVKRYARAS